MRRCIFVLAACGIMLGGTASWGPAQEGKKGVPPTPVVRNEYQLRSLPYADTYVLIRFEKNTGRSWIYSMLHWQELDETTKVPLGKYDIRLVPVGTAVNPREYRAFRIETQTGLTWILMLNKWEEMKDR